MTPAPCRRTLTGMTDSQTPEAAPVRVPNVSPGARSGIDHEVIGANAQEAHEANLAIADASPSADSDDFDATWTLDQQVEWVAAGGDADQRGRRADSVYGQARAEQATDEALGDLSTRLTSAVHGPVPDDQDAPEALTVPEDRTTVDSLLDWVSEAEDDATKRARAEAVLAAEQAKPEEDQRKTLVEPLEALLTDPAQGD